MKSDEPAISSEGLQAGLPTKITVIVFWGLIWAGVIFSLVVLKDIEQRLLDKHISSGERLAKEIERHFKNHPDLNLSALNPKLISLLEKYKMSGIEIVSENETSVLGITRPEMAANKREIIIAPSQKHEKYKHVLITMFYPNLEDEVFNARKEFFVSIGASMLLYGVLLAWILKRVLTKPFFSMISTAQEVTNGNSNVRFDEERQDEFGYLAKFVNKVMDQLLQEQNKLFEEKERAEVTLHSIYDAVITTNEMGMVVYLNPVAVQLTGWDKNEAKNQPIVEVMHITDDRNNENVANPVEVCLKTGQSVAMVDHAVLTCRDEKTIAIAHSAAPIRDRNGNIIGAVMVFHDVGEERRLQHQLSYQASHDALTNLYNRREFETCLEGALLEAQRDNSEHVLCYLDLDQFKIVNDTCGHIAGDKLLQQLAILLDKHVRNSDVLARLGGDEFGILFKYCAMEHAHAAAEKLAASVRDFKFAWHEHSFSISSSIGLVPITSESKSIADALAAADVACYAAKDSGRDRIHVYESDDEELKQRHGEMQWVPRIKEALENNRFTLYYQIISPVNDVTPDHKRFEVLVRMLGDDNEAILPMAFIPAAERYNLMTDIDRWVIKNTLKVMAQRDKYDEKWICSINLSGQSLCKTEFLEFILSEIKQSDVDPGCVCFELTETAAIANLNDATQFITALKDVGCNFSLDDFGSGLSSFSYLKNLKVDFLKIDGSFVKSMVEDPISVAMVEAINQIGHVMNIQTVAEFVENDAIVDLLKNIGVDFAQGYGIHEPAPLNELLTPLSGQRITIAK